MSFIDEVDKQIAKRDMVGALTDIGQDLGFDMEVMPIMEVTPNCDCNRGLEPHEDNILACPKCHKAGVSREVF